VSSIPVIRGIKSVTGAPENLFGWSVRADISAVSGIADTRITALFLAECVLPVFMTECFDRIVKLGYN
jgi:hypothetical protein